MDIIRKYADAGDIVNLRYVFSGAFDADPTFEQYEDDYQYCKRKGVLEDHREMTPLTNDATRWTEDYWYKVQGDLQKNLSDKRLTHMKKMARVVFKGKVELLNAERAAKKRPSPPVAPAASASVAPLPSAESRRATETPAETYEQKVERENQRTIEDMNRANQDYEEKQRQRRAEEERRQRTSEQRHAYARDAESDGASPKKALGIAAIVLILILLAILLTMFLGNKSSRNPQTNLSDQTNVATSVPEQNPN